MIGTGNSIGIGSGNGLLSNTWGAGEELFHNDYYVIVLEQIGGDFLRNQITREMWPDGDEGRSLYLWQGLNIKKPSGNSYYNTKGGGDPEPDTLWLSLETSEQAQGSWSGGGYFVDNVGYFQLDVQSDYIFHIALKSSDEFDVTINVVGQSTSIASLVFGSSAGAGIDYVLPRDGKWHAFEIPVSDLEAKGFTPGWIYDQNYLEFLLGGVSGKSLEMDAVFFYNPNASR